MAMAVDMVDCEHVPSSAGEDPTTTTMNDSENRTSTTTSLSSGNDSVRTDDGGHGGSSHRRVRRREEKNLSLLEDPSISATATPVSSYSTTSTDIMAPSPQEKQNQQEQNLDEGYAAAAIAAISDFGNRSGLGITGDTVDFGCTTTTSPQQPPVAMTLNNNDINNCTEFIDNRSLTYVPIRLACGNVCMCSPQTLAACPMVLRSLQVDITEALKVLPRSVHRIVTRTNIWVNASYEYGDKRDPYVCTIPLRTIQQRG